MKKLFIFLLIWGFVFSYNVNAMSHVEDETEVDNATKVNAGTEVRDLVATISDELKKEGIETDISVQRITAEEKAGLCKRFFKGVISVPCKILRFFFRTKTGFTILVGGFAIFVTFKQYPEEAWKVVEEICNQFKHLLYSRFTASPILHNTDEPQVWDDMQIIE